MKLVSALLTLKRRNKSFQINDNVYLPVICSMVHGKLEDSKETNLKMM